MIECPIIIYFIIHYIEHEVQEKNYEEENIFDLLSVHVLQSNSICNGETIFL